MSTIIPHIPLVYPLYTPCIPNTGGIQGVYRGFRRGIGGVQDRILGAY
jgi:hypothetical protein